MKDTKECPKCRGINIVRIDGFVGAYGTGNNIMTGATVFSGVNVNRYICCDCGYSEEWIDREDLKKVRESKKAKSI
jgi:Zn-finger nucleic acid-binding protein